MKCKNRIIKKLFKRSLRRFISKNVNQNKEDNLNAQKD